MHTLERLQGNETAVHRGRDRLLVLVAHPDDETACAALLQRSRDPIVLFCTDGAPNVEFFWGPFGSRERYATVRRQEAERALCSIGVHEPLFLCNSKTAQTFPDQQLYLNLQEAYVAVRRVVVALGANSIVTPAYEGGHPDHDCCSFLAYLLRQELSLPVWEMPLYHRSERSGKLVSQRFLNSDGGECTLYPTKDELLNRSRMLAIYKSQPDASDYVSSQIERYRSQPAYDYTRPPNLGEVNYEAWKWTMTSSDLCRGFQACLARVYDKHA